jgi:hypothetical protein
MKYQKRGFLVMVENEKRKFSKIEVDQCRAINNSNDKYLNIFRKIMLSIIIVSVLFNAIVIQYMWANRTLSLYVGLGIVFFTLFIGIIILVIESNIASNEAKGIMTIVFACFLMVVILILDFLNCAYNSETYVDGGVSPFPKTEMQYLEKTWNIGDKVVLSGCGIVLESVELAPEVSGLNQYDATFQYYLVRIKFENLTDEAIAFNHKVGGANSENSSRNIVVHEIIEKDDKDYRNYELTRVSEMEEYLGIESGLNERIQPGEIVETTFIVRGRGEWSRLHIILNSDGWAKKRIRGGLGADHGFEFVELTQYYEDGKRIEKSKSVRDNEITYQVDRDQHFSDAY